MKSGLLKIDPLVASQFVGSDGRFEVDVPAGAVTPADMATAGGQLYLALRQVAPASGSSGGGSGMYSFGTFLVQTVDGQRREWTHALRAPLTFKLHVSPAEYALDLRNPVLVFNATFPVNASFNPDPSGPFVPAAHAHLSRTSSARAVFETSDATLVATAFMPSDPTVSFNTDAAVAIFGKPDLFSTNLSAGALSNELPIDVPAGPGGFKPPVALTYTSASVSGQHNPQGAAPWVGEGWNLSLGSVTWAEHNLGTTAQPNWENTWQIADAFGTSAELIPPNTTLDTFCDSGQTHGLSTGITWHTAPESHVKVFAYLGPARLTCLNGPNSVTPPCFRAFLPTGIMEEFGCTTDSLQWYPMANGNAATFQWLVDLITDAYGNQIHVTYQADTATAYGQNYPRDVVLKTVEWDAPGCLNTSVACSTWAPLMRANFVAGQTLSHPFGAICSAGGTPRCDDPVAIGGGLGVPLVQNTFVLNDIQVQVQSGSPPAWHTLRDYQLGYEQSAPTNVTDPVTGLLESTAGKLNLTQLVEIGDDYGSAAQTALPARTFTYTTIANYYEDASHSPSPSTNCGPWWNKGNPGGVYGTCVLWSQSYGGNSSYLASASNGLGLAQTFNWLLARNNTHGVSGGGSATDPFYCNSPGSFRDSYPCDEADDQAWSQVALSQDVGSVVQASQNGQGGTQTNTTIRGTTSYGYSLATFTANPCSDCLQGFFWGSQLDADYLDYYNGKFMGFAQATVTKQDGAVEVHKYHSTLGWGIYDCSQFTCSGGSPCVPNACHSDPWWPLSGQPIVNAFHGHEYEVDYYATDGATLLRKTTTTYATSYPGTGTSVCPPSGVSSSIANGSPATYGSWDGQLVSELDPYNPVGTCDILVAQVNDYTNDGLTAGALPQKTTSYTYDSYGRVTAETITSNDGGGTGSATTIVDKLTYATNDGAVVSLNNAAGPYLVDYPAFSDIEDAAGNRYQCVYTLYDANTSEASSSVTAGQVTSVNRYTSCGTPAGGFNDRSGKISTTSAYDSSGNGNRVATVDPDANAGVGGHTGCTTSGISGTFTNCTSYDGTFKALPISTMNAKGQTTSRGYQAASSATAAGGFGLWPLSTTDPNSQVTSSAYDALGRLTSQTLPGEGAGLTTSSDAYANWCSGTGAQGPCVEVDHTQRLASSAGGPYVPVTASRICDTRAGSGTLCAGQTIASYGTLNLQVAGQGGIPVTGALTVVLNVTVVNPAGPGYLVVYPTGVAQPGTSNINYAAGQTVANLVQVGLGTSGKVAFTAAGGRTDVLVDVEGYVSQNWSGNLTNSLIPSSRICDTRAGSNTQCAGRTVGANASLTIQLTGQGGIPGTGVAAAVMNVAVINQAAAGYLTIYPTGQSPPVVSNITWVAGQTSTNRAVVPAGSGGQVTLANHSGGSIDFLVDVNAWMADGTVTPPQGSLYTPVNPSRICDSRSGTGTNCSGRTIASGGTLTVPVAGVGGVPAMGGSNQPTAATLNVVVLNNSAPGYLVVYPSGTARPATSDLNFNAQMVADLDIVSAIGSDGNVAIYNGSSRTVDVLVDASGYYAPGPQTTVTSRAFYDGWGHLVETRTAGPNNQDVVKYLVYDNSNRLWKESVAYFVTAYTGLPGVMAYSIPDSTQKVTQNVYDGLGRLVSTTDPLNNTTTNAISVVCNAGGTGDTDCYEQTLTVDPLGHQGGGLVDALGRRQYVQRFTGNTTPYAVYATTKYTYDVTGNLIQILQPDGTTRTSFVYDMAGRKTSMTDPDLGLVSHAYDQNGNATQSIDARGSAGTVYVGYDGLNRPLWRNSTNSPTGAYQSLTYDSTVGGNQGIGRLTSETFAGGPNNSLSGAYSYIYDPRGQETTATLTVGGTSYPVRNSFDDAGSTLTQIYPTNEVVTTGYTAQGWLSSLGTSQGNTSLLSGASYSGFGGASRQITSASLGGAPYQYSATFDALLRPTDVKVANGATVLFEQARSFDGAGNVSSANTTLPAGTDNQAFCYDEQDRLTWAGAAGTPPCGASLTPGTLAAAQYTQAFGYDNLGRLTSGPLGSYAYGNSAHLHAATAIGTTWTAAYDAAGGMSCRAPSSATTCAGTQTGAQLMYDTEGSLSAWQNAPSNPTATAGFLYDNQGNRVEQQVTQNGVTTTTIYVGNLEQVATTGPTTTTTTFYYAGSARIALAVNGTFSYLASDGLASATVALNASGGATASSLYAPYGGSRYSNGTMPTDYGFTGQHADSATGLDYYNARYYDPVAGQFTSADTILPGQGYDVFSLSRYAYVEGNPETRTDPSGRCPWCLAAVVGAAIGGGLSYGSQVVGNLQRGQSLGSALTHVDVGEIGKQALVGFVIGGTGGLGGTALAGRLLLGGAQGGAAQIGDNLLHGRAWTQDVLQSTGMGVATAGLSSGGGAALRRVLNRSAAGVIADGDRSLVGSVCGLSFSADTKVATSEGPRPIASIKQGDEVLAYDPQTKQVTAQTVKAVFVNHDDDRVDITLETLAPSEGDTRTSNAPRNTAPSTETIHTTSNHLWLSGDRGWVKAGALQIDEPIQMANGSMARVEGLQTIPGVGTMYDLSLEQVHTFAVGAGLFVVHNCPGVDESSMRIRHYTNRRGLKDIQDSGRIEAGDRNRVFAESARRKPLAPRDAEDRYGLKRGRGRDYVETDVSSNRVSQVLNEVTGMVELQVEGDVPLVNARFTRRLE